MMQLQRKFKGIWAVVLAALVGASWVGCTSSGGGGARFEPSASDGTPMAVDPGADRLFNGDRIMIVFSGPPNPPPPHMEQIRSDGYISPPLVSKSVQAAGRTIGELQQELYQLYVPDYFRTLTITVRAEDRYFFVGGHVMNPGRQPYLSGMTLTKAIQVAGDFTIWASKGNVQITRTDGRTEEHDVNAILRDPRLDPPIYPNDAVYVARRGPISI